MTMPQIAAPYGGQLKITGPREVTITVNEMNRVTAIINNIDLNVIEKEASLYNFDSIIICLIKQNHVEFPFTAIYRNIFLVANTVKCSYNAFKH